MMFYLLIGGNILIFIIFWLVRLFQKENEGISEESTETNLSLPPGFVVESRRNSILRRKSIDLSKVMDQQLALRMQKLHKKFAKQATAQHAFDLPNIIHQLTNAKDNFSANRNSVPPGMRKWRKTTGTRGSINLRAPNFEEKLDGKTFIRGF
ncbi:Oidioi.mRNA.OKI2018_I69.chr2.g5097.t1.cds [Oikopleura dioica]|uniref:Oidioi.mRNA.OKI2018_I69.chr2.g5097.t1.cds n=1 Tax=Oikopleura dioica TaxID=34765 RepID=A0ABN7T3P0_OIKDI|nr:Oidioi.mRNA.OKI2018_I69.chr2.g5097.t1.cds [Oikopleura dioica]